MTSSTKSETKGLKLLKFMPGQPDPELLLPENFLVLPRGSRIQLVGEVRSGPSPIGQCITASVEECVFHEDVFLLPASQFKKLLDELGANLKEIDGDSEEKENQKAAEENRADPERAG